MNHSNSHNKGIRWWPLPLLVIVYLTILGFIWASDSQDRQSQVMLSIGYGFLLGLSTVAWLLFFARLAKKQRLIVLAVFLTGLVLVPTLVEVRGVSGDLIPILAWRWTKAPDELLTQDQRLASGEASPIQSSPNDYAKFLGPKGTGILSGPKLVRDWTAQPPIEKWRIEVGLGWSAFAVVGDYAVTMEQRGEQEMVVCYDLQTGKIRWSHADLTRHVDELGGDGPRATPTLYDGKVYSLGARGTLNCLDLATGQKVWAVDVLAENQASAPPFGVSVSPVVVGNQLLIVAGGSSGRSLVAYDRHDGHFLFGGGDDPAGYSTPVPVQLAGVDQVLVFNALAVAGHDAQTGTVLWSYPWPSGTEHVAQPLITAPNQVVISSGYGIGSKLLSVTQTDGRYQVTPVWASTQMKAKFSQLIQKGSVIYGLDDGILACINLTDGSRRWKGGRYGHGQMMLVGDLLLVLSERGEVVLVEASPDHFKELSKRLVLQGKTWNHPALAGNMLLVRNATEAVCLQLPTE